MSRGHVIYLYRKLFLRGQLTKLACGLASRYQATGPSISRMARQKGRGSAKKTLDPRYGLHDQLDRAVLDAYGWADLAPALVGKPGGTVPSAHKSTSQTEAEETLLQRLVTLNAERAAEERRGVIRWLRPEFQSPERKEAQQEVLLPEYEEAIAAAPSGKLRWPKALPEQVRAVRSALVEQPSPVTAEQVARSFGRAQTKRVAELLDTLATLGQVRATDDGRYTAA